MNLDIVAEAYNILIFTPDASDSSYNSSEGYSDWEAEVHKKIENYFLSHPVAMLFRHQVFSYAILVKGQRDTIKKNTCDVWKQFRRSWKKPEQMWTGLWQSARSRPSEQN